MRRHLLTSLLVDATSWIAIDVQPAASSPGQAKSQDDGRLPAEGECTLDRRAREAAGLPGEAFACQLSAAAGEEPSGDTPVLRELAALSRQVEERPRDNQKRAGVLLCLAAPNGPESLGGRGPYLRQVLSQARLLRCPQRMADAEGGLELDDGSRGSATGARLPPPKPF